LLNLISGAEENGKRAEKEEKERIPVSKRLVITRRVVNDKRVVLPKESDSKEDQPEDDKKPCESRSSPSCVINNSSDEEGAKKRD
jgi:hypothetical protein